MDIPIESAKLELDPARFLPSHVYRVEVRRARIVLGTAVGRKYSVRSEI